MQFSNESKFTVQLGKHKMINILWKNACQHKIMKYFINMNPVWNFCLKTSLNLVWEPLSIYFFISRCFIVSILSEIGFSTVQYFFSLFKALDPKFSDDVALIVKMEVIWSMIKPSLFACSYQWLCTTIAITSTKKFSGLGMIIN